MLNQSFILFQHQSTNQSNNQHPLQFSLPLLILIVDLFLQQLLGRLKMFSSRRLFKLFIALFLLLELASCVAVSPRTTPAAGTLGKRPAVDDGKGGNPSKKPATSGPFDPTKKITPEEWEANHLEMVKRTNKWGATVFSNFVKQSAPSAFFNKPNEATSSGTTYTVMELKAFAGLSFEWVMQQDEAKKYAFWQYVNEENQKVKGWETKQDSKLWTLSNPMLAISYSPGTGLGLSTVVNEWLKKGSAPILERALGTTNAMHAEDGSWEELEKKGNPGPGDTANPARYKPGTITVVVGYKKSDYTWVKGVGWKLNAGATPSIIPKCSQNFGSRTKSCSTVATTLGITGP